MSLQYTVWETAAEVANGPVLNENVVAVGGASALSGVIDASARTGRESRRVRLFAEEACYVIWGETPTALNDGTGGRMFGAENPEYFEIQANFLIAVIQRT